MSDEFCASCVKSEVEELIKAGTINASNWENMSFISKLVSQFQQAHEKDKFKRPKINKFFNNVLHEHFSEETKSEPEIGAEPDTTSNENNNSEDSHEESTNEVHEEK